MPLMDYLKNGIEVFFKEHPYRFFTEHDIHTQLAFIATEYLKKNEKAVAKTKDGLIVNRVHHEYPTPFRCDMNNYDFRVISEAEFNRRSKEKRGFRARRGFIDLVVLNPEFIKSNDLVVVSGKRYHQVRLSLRQQKCPALDLAVEVVYHPTFDEKPHEGIMQRRVDSTRQDYKKLIALMDPKYSSRTVFCKEAAMLFFSNTKHKNMLDGKLQRFPSQENIQIIKIIQH